jgi:hypothetical protein
MDRVLLFAERKPTGDQVSQVLHHLEDLPGRAVTALLPLVSTRPSVLMGEMAGAHGLPAQRMMGGIHATRSGEVAEVRAHLSHLVGMLRGAGHRTHGELLLGPVVSALVREVHVREPETVLLVTRGHRIARWLHHDLERRLRHHTDVQVVTVAARTHPLQA